MKPAPRALAASALAASLALAACGANPTRALDGGTRDQSPADLASTDFANTDFANTDFANADLANTDFANADLANFDFAAAANPDLSIADFSTAPDFAAADFATPPDLAGAQHVHIFIDNFCNTSTSPQSITWPLHTPLQLTWHNHSVDYDADVWLSYGGGYLGLAQGAEWADPFQWCLNPNPYDGYADVSIAGGGTTACPSVRFMIHCQ